MKPFRPYRDMSDAILRASIAVYSAPVLCWLFRDRIGAMEWELTLRELPLLAEESGGYLVEWILGVQ